MSCNFKRSVVIAVNKETETISSLLSKVVMQSKRVQILILLLVLSAIYSLVSIFLVNEQTHESAYLGDNTSNTSNAFDNDRLPVNQSETSNKQITRQSSVQNNTAHNSANNDVEYELPKQFILVGTRLKAENSSEQSEVLLSYKGGLHEHFENDFLLDTDMQLTMVYENQIDVSYKERIFTLALHPPNLLASNFREPEKTYSEFLEMTPEEIGSRPRILEHLIILTPTPYIADGQLIYPGLNPALFQQAGFKEDDVLKTINGKSVTIEPELDEIKKEMVNASTLVFEVMRKGRMITLYLDIPSEALELKR